MLVAAWLLLLAQYYSLGYFKLLHLFFYLFVSFTQLVCFRVCFLLMEFVPSAQCDASLKTLEWFPRLLLLEFSLWKPCVLSFNFHLRNLNTHLGALDSVNTLPSNTWNHRGKKSGLHILFLLLHVESGRWFDVESPWRAKRSRDFLWGPNCPQNAKAMISSFRLDLYHKSGHCYQHQRLSFLLSSSFVMSPHVKFAADVPCFEMS